MLLANCLLKIVLTMIVVCMIIITISATTNVDGGSTTADSNPETIKRFKELLNSIASVNEERMKALKKYIALDDLDPFRGILEPAHESNRKSSILMMNTRTQMNRCSRTICTKRRPCPCY